MKKKPFSKVLLGGMSAPVLAAMIASVFFSITPGTLFAGPLNGNGIFVTRVDTANGAQNFRVRISPGNPNIVIIIFGSNNQGNRVVKRFLRDNGSTSNNPNVSGPLSPSVDAIIQQCFPEGGGTPTAPFSGSDVQAIYDFFLNN